jgi:hypothetical protein
MVFIGVLSSHWRPNGEGFLGDFLICPFSLAFPLFSALISERFGLLSQFSRQRFSKAGLGWSFLVALRDILWGMR